MASKRQSAPNVKQRAASGSPRLSKRKRGRTPIATTPVTTRSRVTIAPEARSSIEHRVRGALAPFGTRIERASIRFEDVNGPKGGVDTKCRIKVVLSGGRSLIVEEQAAGVRESANRAVRRIGKEIRKRAERDGGKTPRQTAVDEPRRVQKRSKPPEQDSGSLIGRRVGRGKENLAAALERPEKERGDAYVDTAAVDTSATARRAGGSYSARRNSKRETSGMTHALEDSRTKPSRKSTRASGNRTKAASQLTRRAKRRTHSSSARAMRNETE